MDGERAQGTRVVERGVLTASDEVWAVAVRRARVIGPLAAGASVGKDAADAAAAELGISRRQVYVLLRRWREGEGVVSDLLPRRSSGGRGGRRLSAEVEAVLAEMIGTRYLHHQRRSVAAVYREVARVCRSRGLPVPARNTLTRRIWALDPVRVVSVREGPDAARRLGSAGGEPPAVPDGGDRCGEPVCGGDGRHAGGAVGDIGRVVSGSHGDRQAGLAGTARGGGGR